MSEICPKLDFELECYDTDLMEQLKNATDNHRVKYKVAIKIKDIEDGTINFSVLFPDIFAKCEDTREKYGTIFVYKRKDTDQALANSECTVRNIGKADIDPENEYIDEIGQRIELDRMLEDIKRYNNVTVIVGTIADFMNPQKPDIQDIIYTLNSLRDYNVTLYSRLEQKYEYNLYNEALPIADAFCKLNADILRTTKK